MEIFNKISSILSELCGTEAIYPEQKLQSDLGLDSLQMVALLIMIEECFGITLDESDMNPFDLQSVRDVVSLAEKYQGGSDNEKTDKEG